MFLLRCFIDGEIHQEITIEPGQEALIGRGSFADIEIDQYPGISRKHLRVIHLTDKLVVQKISQKGRLIVDGKDYTTVEITGNFDFSVPPYNFEVICKKKQVVDEVGRSVSAIELSQFVSSSEASKLSSVRENSGINSNEDSFSAFAGNIEKTNLKSQNLIPIFKIIEDDAIIDEFELKGSEWRFGRSKENDVSINHQKASRNHFKVFKVDDHFFVEDLKSSNGTFLNGHKLPNATSIELNSGDIISIHDYRLLFEIKGKNLEKQIFNLPQVIDPSQVKLSEMQSTNQSSVPVGAQKVKSPLLSQIHEIGVRRLALMGFVAVMFLGFMVDIIFPDLFNSKTDPSRMIAERRMLEEEKVIETLKVAALQYIDQANWSNCLSEVQRIQDIRPDDPDAQEIGIKCQTALDRLERQNQLETQERDRELLLEEVRIVIDECAYLVNQGTKVLNECLQRAIELSPGNEEISKLLDLAGAVDRKMEEDMIKQEEYKKRLAAGRWVLNRAGWL